MFVIDSRKMRWFAITGISNKAGESGLRVCHLSHSRFPRKLRRRIFDHTINKERSAERSVTRNDLKESLPCRRKVLFDTGSSSGSIAANPDIDSLDSYSIMRTIPARKSNLERLQNPLVDGPTSRRFHTNEEDSNASDERSPQAINATHINYESKQLRIKTNIANQLIFLRTNEESTKNDTIMLITNNWWLLFLVGSTFVLPATATDDLLQSRELKSPPWATGSICTPDGPFYNPNAVDQCKTCCREQKCHNFCLNQCKSNAASTAQNRKDFCRSYDGDKRDGPPAWGTCRDKLGKYKESHCSDYDGCVTKYEARHVANDAWYYCDDLKPPRSCSDFCW